MKGIGIQKYAKSNMQVNKEALRSSVFYSAINILQLNISRVVLSF